MEALEKAESIFAALVPVPTAPAREVGKDEREFGASPLKAP
jgi:hypothetical protein